MSQEKKHAVSSRIFHVYYYNLAIIRIQVISNKNCRITIISDVTVIEARSNFLQSPTCGNCRTLWVTNFASSRICSVSKMEKADRPERTTMCDACDRGQWLGLHQRHWSWLATGRFASRLAAEQTMTHISLNLFCLLGRTSCVRGRYKPGAPTREHWDKPRSSR